MRTESKTDVLGESKPDIQFYNNLPFAIESRFPLRGTTKWDSDKNTLLLSEATNVYMLRSHKWGDWNKMMELGGWEATGMNGNFVGESSVEVYKRFFEPGTYQIDATSALYLFEGGNLTILIISKILLVYFLIRNTFFSFLFAFISISETVASQTRRMQRGTHTYHVGVSTTGLNAVWRQGSVKPSVYQYSNSFEAYDQQKKGTIPYAVTYSKDKSKEDCFIKQINASKHEANYHNTDFIFWAYPSQVHGSIEISLRSKIDVPVKSAIEPSFSIGSGNSNSRESLSIASFWAPNFENNFGNYHL